MYIGWPYIRPKALVAQWIEHLHVEQKAWGLTPTGRRYHLGGFLTAHIPLYSLFEGIGYGMSFSFRKKKTPPGPCLVRYTGIVLYLYLFTLVSPIELVTL